MGALDLLGGHLLSLLALLPRSGSRRLLILELLSRVEAH
jgi:hypothetical protein